MNRTQAADTRSPWYEAFAPAQNATETRRLTGTAFPAPATRAEPAPSHTESSEANWATAALFECYNG